MRISPVRRAQISLVVLGGFFATVGITLLALARWSPPPPLASLEKRVGLLTDRTLRMRSRPASLTLVVDGERLSIQGDDDRLRAMYSMLRNGDTVAVWTSKSTIGPPKIWQVERRGRPVVRYEERRQRDLDLNTRMVPFAWFMVVLGVVGFSAAAAWPAIMRRRWTPS